MVAFLVCPELRAEAVQPLIGAERVLDGVHAVSPERKAMTGCGTTV